MKGIRYHIGLTFLNAEDKRFEEAMSMPMETSEQRTAAYSHRHFGLNEDQYQSVNKLCHAYAQKKSHSNDYLYAYYYGIRFRWELFKEVATDFISF